MIVPSGFSMLSAKDEGVDQDTIDQLEKLKLDEQDINMLYTVFAEIDVDASATVSREEFYDFFQCEQDEFTDAVFRVLDVDNSGQVDFREFSLTLWNYLTFDRKSLALFAFSMFDEDKSRTMEKSEVCRLVKLVYGIGFNDNVRLKRVMEVLDLDGDGEVNADEFVLMCKQYPMLLWPAHAQQQMLRKRIIGDRFWWHVSKKRKAAFPGMTDIYEILKDDEAFNQTVGAPAGCSKTRMPYQIKQQLRHLGNEEWSRYVSATDVCSTAPITAWQPACWTTGWSFCSHGSTSKTGKICAIIPRSASSRKG